MAKVALFIKSKTKPGKRDDVRRLWEKHLKGRAEANPAQETYYFCYDNDDPDTFLLFEVYNDPAVMAENAQAEWFASYMEDVGPMMEGYPVVPATITRAQFFAQFVWLSTNNCPNLPNPLSASDALDITVQGGGG